MELRNTPVFVLWFFVEFEALFLTTIRFFITFSIRPFFQAVGDISAGVQYVAQFQPKQVRITRDMKKVVSRSHLGHSANLRVKSLSEKIR